MEAPRIVYVDTDGCGNAVKVHNVSFGEDGENIKYVRSDLVELNWIDIRNILSIAREVEDENDDCPLLKCELCDEILRRFNEQRNK